MFKKSLAVLCLSTLLLTSCGNASDNSSTNKNTTPNTTPETKVEVVEMQDQDTSRLKKDDSGNYIVDSLPQFSEMEIGEEYAIMSTSMGDIKIRFFPKTAPNAVNNFIIHSKNGYYDDVIFHRVIPKFMIQGGDPDGLGTGGDSIWGKPFNDEFAPDMLNFGGSLSMANSGPNTNGSQFFINLNVKLSEKYYPQLEKAGYSQTSIDKYKEVGGNPHLDLKHTVFGQVFEGMDVVNAIALAETNSGNKPKTPIIIKNITFENYKYEK